MRYCGSGTNELVMNLHRMGQMEDSSIVEMTQTMHQKNTKTLHINNNKMDTGIDRDKFKVWRKQYCQKRAKDFE